MITAARLQELIASWSHEAAVARASLRQDDYAARCQQTVEALRELESQGWQPIHTAPKDGTHVFVWNAHEEFPNYWLASWRLPTESEFWVSGGDEPSESDETFSNDYGWFSDEGFTMKLFRASHWRPNFSPPCNERENDRERAQP